ncbi:MAG: phosphatidate cytidylyltransferase [Sedimentisphaerales bacterium]|nr:phosphatidate cytidylyltransferase [Sedimentisphaerales bacterium]
MIVGFAGLMLLDGRLDSFAANGTILMTLVALIAIPANIEFAKLADCTGHKVFLPLTIPASIFAAGWLYFVQFERHIKFLHQSDFFLIEAIIGGVVVCAIFFYQARKYGTSGVMANCGASLFAIAYLGVLSGFVVGLRCMFGVWSLLMFVFTIKSADIGAYAIGKMFGKHKFSSAISPGKTWEGMAGAVVLAAIVGSLFAYYCGIMPTVCGAIFGAIFAFIGQLGDLAESMLKRDAQQKDSSHVVPGFGGILDVIDSPLVAAPFAFAYFWLIHRWN